MRVRIPAALRLWAAERQDQLSDSTHREVSIIAAAIAESSLGERDVSDPGNDLSEALEGLFSAERAQRAGLLIGVVANWHAQRNPPTIAPPPAVTPATPLIEPGSTSAGPLDDRTGDPVDDDAPIGGPAFLGSDKVDEEDDQRLYGGDRRYGAWLVGLIVVTALLAGATWFALSGRTNNDSSATADLVPAPTDTPAADQPVTDEPASEVELPTPPPTVAPSVTAEPEALAYWADITTILNSGSGEISASTYSVSASNRAVLTGHTAAVTGIVVSNDGRVLTSGADMRLVDWGADVEVRRVDEIDHRRNEDSGGRRADPFTHFRRDVEYDAVEGSGDEGLLERGTSGSQRCLGFFDAFACGGASCAGDLGARRRLLEFLVGKQIPLGEFLRAFQLAPGLVGGETRLAPTGACRIQRTSVENDLRLVLGVLDAEKHVATRNTRALLGGDFGNEPGDPGAHLRAASRFDGTRSGVDDGVLDASTFDAVNANGNRGGSKEREAKQHDDENHADEDREAAKCTTHGITSGRDNRQRAYYRRW